LRLHSNSATAQPAARNSSTTRSTFSSISRKIASSEIGQAEQRLPPGQVIDDVHHLQHDARGALVRAGARRDQEQVAGRDVVGDLVGQRQLVDPGQVVDGVGADRLEPIELGVVGGVELTQPQEPVDRGVVGEAQLVPVDDRVAAQQEPHGLEVRHLEVGQGRGPRHAREHGLHHGPSVLRGVGAMGPPGRRSRTAPG
jgi:hypothetical protein